MSECRSHHLRLMAVSGSLRAASTNTVLLRAAQRLAPRDSEIDLYGGLADLPHYNADLDDATDLPAPVARFRAQVRTADGLLLACPEYARGVPGSFKNALDWLVGDLYFHGKHVAIFNASPRAVESQAALRLILNTVSAKIIEAASITIPLLGTKLDADAVVRDEQLAAPLRAALHVFVDALREAAASESRT